MKPKARKSNIVIQESGNELLIYDLKTNKAYCLNTTSSMVWQMCDGKNSVENIASKVSKQLKTDISKEFVWVALDQLNKDELLDDYGKAEELFANLSRREVIRKAGFASVVALPIVSSVVAPHSSLSSSLLANLSSCTLDTECASGNCFGSRCCASTVTGSVPLDTLFCAAPGNCAPGAATFCCRTGTSDSGTTSFPSGFCGSGAVLCTCD